MNSERPLAGEDYSTNYIVVCQTCDDELGRNLTAKQSEELRNEHKRITGYKYHLVKLRSGRGGFSI